ncbi:MAG: hypothetical protein INR73_28160 [Williamsia sp.]|nr:hypothetical protein [Williamsia sp.]
MAFDEHLQRIPKANWTDYEYVNKGSRQPVRVLVYAVLFALAMWAFALWRWYDMDRSEQTGSELSITPLEWGLYKLGGKWALPLLFALCGAFFIWLGFRGYARLKKMKES